MHTGNDMIFYSLNNLVYIIDQINYESILMIFEGKERTETFNYYRCEDSGNFNFKRFFTPQNVIW